MVSLNFQLMQSRVTWQGEAWTDCLDQVGLWAELWGTVLTTDWSNRTQPTASTGPARARVRGHVKTTKWQKDDITEIYTKDKLLGERAPAKLPLLKLCGSGDLTVYFCEEKSLWFKSRITQELCLCLWVNISGLSRQRMNPPLSLSRQRPMPGTQEQTQTTNISSCLFYIKNVAAGSILLVTYGTSSILPVKQPPSTWCTEPQSGLALSWLLRIVPPRTVNIR